MPSVSIFQNCYQREQIKDVNTQFIPYDGIKNDPLLYEMGPIIDLFKTGRHKVSEYVGLVSPKFENKAKISGERFLTFIQSNLGYDVYFINPFPQNGYFHFNVWEQGELWHPGICLLTQKLFDRVGYQVDISRIGRHDRNTLLYCNYWVGNEKFWNLFMDFLIPLFDHVIKSKAEIRDQYFQVTDHLRPTPMFPFVFERLFSTFLSLNPMIRARGYPHSREEKMKCCITDAERSVICTMEDVVDNWDLEGEYNQERRNLFKALGILIYKYDDLYFSINGPAY